MRNGLFLLFVLLVALGPTAASAAPPDVRGPLHALTWTPPPRDCPNLTAMVWVREGSFPETAAAESRRAPAGRAGIFFFDMTRGVMNHPYDRCLTPDGKRTKWHGLWPDNGVKILRDRAEFFFRRFRAAGGRADFVVLDHEDAPSMWGLKRENLDAIAADPRADALRRELGFDDLAKIYDFQRSPEYLQWNAVVTRIVTDALNTGVFEPARAAYPDVGGSNFESYVLAREHVVPEQNGHHSYTLNQFGTHASPALYGTIGHLRNARLGGADGPAYGDTPLAVLRWHVNRLRAIARSSDAPLRPWISHKTFAESVFRDNDYYQELLYHLALHGADGLLLWNPVGGVDDPNHATLRTPETDRVVDRCLTELNERFGDGPRRCATPDGMRWDSPVVATGMTIGQGGGARVLWRVTVTPGTTSVRVNPAGNAIELKGAVGAWYETKPDAPAPTFEPM